MEGEIKIKGDESREIIGLIMDKTKEMIDLILDTEKEAQQLLGIDKSVVVPSYVLTATSLVHLKALKEMFNSFDLCLKSGKLRFRNNKLIFTTKNYKLTITLQEVKK